jgi:hypothetical protein
MNLKISKTSSRPTRADAHANATAEILSWATSRSSGEMTRLDMREPDQLMVPIAHPHYRRGRSCL